MSRPTLHYIYDPLCGWCYGAAPLLKAAADDGLKIALHAGGMMMGPQRQAVTPALRDFVLPHIGRIVAITGQAFGDAYANELLRDGDAVFDSEPPITAILAAGDKGLELLEKIQHAQFFEGRRIADPAVLLELAKEIGLDPEAFAASFEKNAGVVTRQHVEQSRELLRTVGGHGFPTFAYQSVDARRSGEIWRMVDSARYLGRVPEWRDALSGMLQ